MIDPTRIVYVSKAKDDTSSILSHSTATTSTITTASTVPKAFTLKHRDKTSPPLPSTPSALKGKERDSRLEEEIKFVWKGFDGDCESENGLSEGQVPLTFVSGRPESGTSSSWRVDSLDRYQEPYPYQHPSLPLYPSSVYSGRSSNLSHTSGRFHTHTGLGLFGRPIVFRESILTVGGGIFGEEGNTLDRNIESLESPKESEDEEGGDMMSKQRKASQDLSPSRTPPSPPTHLRIPDPSSLPSTSLSPYTAISHSSRSPASSTVPANVALPLSVSSPLSGRTLNGNGSLKAGWQASPSRRRVDDGSLAKTPTQDLMDFYLAKENPSAITLSPKTTHSTPNPATNYAAPPVTGRRTRKGSNEGPAWGMKRVGMSRLFSSTTNLHSDLSTSVPGPSPAVEPKAETSSPSGKGLGGAVGLVRKLSGKTSLSEFGVKKRTAREASEQDERNAFQPSDAMSRSQAGKTSLPGDAVSPKKAGLPAGVVAVVPIRDGSSGPPGHQRVKSHDLPPLPVESVASLLSSSDEGHAQQSSPSKGNLKRKTSLKHLLDKFPLPKPRGDGKSVKSGTSLEEEMEAERNNGWEMVSIPSPHKPRSTKRMEPPLPALPIQRVETRAAGLEEMLKTPPTSIDMLEKQEWEVLTGVNGKSASIGRTGSMKGKVKRRISRKKSGIKHSKSRESLYEAKEDDAIGRPMTVLHNLHVTSSFKGLPPSWLEELRAQGISQKDLEMIMAGQRQKASSISSLRAIGIGLDGDRGDPFAVKGGGDDGAMNTIRTSTYSTVEMAPQEPHRRGSNDTGRKSSISAETSAAVHSAACLPKGYAPFGRNSSASALERPQLPEAFMNQPPARIHTPPLLNSSRTAASRTQLSDGPSRLAHQISSESLKAYKIPVDFSGGWPGPRNDPSKSVGRTPSRPQHDRAASESVVTKGSFSASFNRMRKNSSDTSAIISRLKQLDVSAQNSAKQLFLKKKDAVTPPMGSGVAKLERVESEQVIEITAEEESLSLVAMPVKRTTPTKNRDGRRPGTGSATSSPLSRQTQWTAPAQRTSQASHTSVDRSLKTPSLADSPKNRLSADVRSFGNMKLIFEQEDDPLGMGTGEDWAKEVCQSLEKSIWKRESTRPIGSRTGSMHGSQSESRSMGDLRSVARSVAGSTGSALSGSQGESLVTALKTYSSYQGLASTPLSSTSLAIPSRISIKRVPSAQPTSSIPNEATAALATPLSTEPLSTSSGSTGTISPDEVIRSPSVLDLDEVLMRAPLITPPEGLNFPFAQLREEAISKQHQQAARAVEDETKLGVGIPSGIAKGKAAARVPTPLNLDKANATAVRPLSFTAGDEQNFFSLGGAIDFPLANSPAFNDRMRSLYLSGTEESWTNSLRTESPSFKRITNASFRSGAGSVSLSFDGEGNPLPHRTSGRSSKTSFASQLYGRRRSRAHSFSGQSRLSEAPSSMEDMDLFSEGHGLGVVQSAWRVRAGEGAVGEEGRREWKAMQEGREGRRMSADVA